MIKTRVCYFVSFIKNGSLWTPWGYQLRGGDGEGDPSQCDSIPPSPPQWRPVSPPSRNPESQPPIKPLLPIPIWIFFGTLRTHLSKYVSHFSQIVNILPIVEGIKQKKDLVLGVKLQFRSSSIKGCLPLTAVFHLKSSSLKCYQPSKVVLHKRSTIESHLQLKVIFIEGRLSLKVVFHQRSSSIGGSLPLKVIFLQRSCIKHFLPSKILFHQR